MAPRSSDPLDEQEARYDQFDNVDSNEILNFYSENEGLGSVPRGLAGSSSRHPLRPTAGMEVQPAAVSRFRYDSENRNRTIMYGANSSEGHKTYPSVRISDYEGPVKIQLSCVSQDAPYSPHPHKVVSQENCKDGVMTIFGNITAENRVVPLMNFGIQCTKRADFDESLSLRKKMRVDPFRTGFERHVYTTLSHHHVRLAVQVFVADAAGRCRMPLAAVASDVITDQPLVAEIVHVSHASGSARGGTELVLLTEKLPSGDIKVVFEEKSTGWRVEARPLLVHKRFGLVVCTPPYRDPDTKTPASVSISVSHAHDNVNTTQGYYFEYESDLPRTSLAASAPKRRCIEKGPHPTLITDRSLPSQSPQPSTSARAGPNRCDIKSFDESFRTGQLLPNYQPSYQTGQTSHTRLPLPMNSHQIGQSSLTGPPLSMNCHQMGESTLTGPNLAMNSHQMGMGQSTLTGPNFAMNSHQMGEYTSTGQPFAKNSHQMGEYTSTGQPFAKNSHQMGEYTSTGQPFAKNSHQMGEYTSTGQPFAKNSHQMGEYTSTGQPFAKNSHQMGEYTSTGQPFVKNSHQMGEYTSTGQPLAMNCHQMGEYTSTGQPFAKNSHQMGEYTLTGQPLAMNCHQMGEYTSTGQPFAKNSHQMGEYTSTGQPFAKNSHQMGEYTSTGQPLAMNAHQLGQTSLDGRSSHIGQSFLKIQSHTEQITSMQTNFNAPISKQPFSIRSSYPKDNPSVIKQPSEVSLLDLHSVEGQFSPIEQVSVLSYRETHDMLEVEEMETLLVSPAPKSNRDPTEQTLQQHQNDQQMVQGLDEDAKNLLDELFDPNLKIDKEIGALSDSLDKTLKIALTALGYE